jgi:hypothetical protein
MQDMALQARRRAMAVGRTPVPDDEPDRKIVRIMCAGRPLVLAERLEDLLVLGEPALALLREDEAAVLLDLEDAARALDQPGLHP